MTKSKNTRAVIHVDDVNKIFNQGSSEEVVALQDINLGVQSGEFVSLIGPSGCGKSTLLRLIANLIEPTTGTLSVNDKSPEEARMNGEYGMVFQAATLYNWRTVIRNVQLPLEIMKYPKAERQQKAHTMLELVELDSFANHFPWQLSGGMQQRVSIARALVFEPSILLMDEPFGALDEFTRERLNMELLKIWEDTSVTIVFVTHSIPEAVFLSSRIVVMSPRPGRITEIVENDLPYPRVFETRDTPEFHSQVARVREHLRNAYADD